MTSDMYYAFWLIVVVSLVLTAIDKFRVFRTNRRIRAEQEEAARSAELAARAAVEKEEREKILIEEEKERNSIEHQHFVAEQRRLMKDSLRYDILKRDNFRCQLCGSTAQDGVRLHVDHIIPVSKGGLTEPSNLRVLCERCNMGKRDKIE